MPLALLLVVLAATLVQSAEQHLRLRIAWGGGSPRQWVGSISLTQGTIHHVSPLGVEADDAGTMWVQRSGAWVRQQSPRGYTALDLHLAAPAQAKLLISLIAQEDQPGRPTTLEMPLSELLHGQIERELDDKKNRILVRRAPGDRLRVHFPPDRAAMVYAPGEVLRAWLRPYLLPVKPGTLVRFKMVVADSAGNEIWTQQYDRTAAGDQFKEMMAEAKLPEIEGVYNLTIEASPRDLRSRFWFRRVVARRVVQFVVLHPHVAAAPLAQPGLWQTVREIDPAQPTWWNQLKHLIPSLSEGPLDSGDVTVLQDHPLGPITQLAAKAKNDVAWAAYAIPISQVGTPHLLEVEYPSNVSQTLGVSIIEPDAAGQVVPIGLDSGVYLPSEAQDRPGEWSKHRLLFWPRTKAPLVLLANRRPGTSAVYGKIRVLGGPPRPPRLFPPANTPVGRGLLAYLDRPYFPESLSAESEADAESKRALDSWLTFYQGGTRLVDYLHHAGYSGLMLGVLGDGGTIYPSRLLQPNTRFDSGQFFGDGRDPVQKDVLEMLFRLFDREGLHLVAALNFSTPLPELEALVRQGGPTSVGIRPIGRDGRSWLETRGARDGQAPYYNTLHPRVQQAMRNVVREVVARYGHHPSFAGLALQLSPDSYAVLPGAEWGLDDATITAFESDTKLTVPGGGDGRFADRAESLTGPQREAWLAWRAGKLREFYREVQREIALLQPRRATLFLAGAKLLDDPAARYALRPQLPSVGSIRDVLLNRGLDNGQLRSLHDVVFLRPRQIAPLHDLRRQAVPLELQQGTAIDAEFANTRLAAGLSFHPPQPTRVKSFDEASPFEDSFTWLVSQPLPSDAFNRERFMQALAARDMPLLTDGGRLLPMGQEASLREFAAIYRQLPPGPFQTVDAGKTQPVTVRTFSWQDRTWVYLVNDSPWRTRVLLRVAGPQAALQLLGARQGGAALRQDAVGVYWELDLEPFELAGGWFAAPQVGLRVEVQVQQQVLVRLKQRIDQLGLRVAALRTPEPVDVLSNPEFETSGRLPGEVPGWVKTDEPGVTVRLDSTQRHDGVTSVYMSTEGPVAALASEMFDVPPSGRLAVLVHLRTANEANQPTLNVAIQGPEGSNYYHHAPVGADPQATKRLRTAWEPFIFNANDLPPDISRVRVRFDLLKPKDMKEPAEVWIDSVQVMDLHFSPQKEHRELLKLVQAADVSLKDGKLSDCRRMLDSYWPRFLQLHVPAPPPQPARAVVPPQPAKPATPKKDVGWLDRVRKWTDGWF